MNFILHDLLGVILEGHIDDILIKFTTLSHHLAGLRLALERMYQYDFKLNLLKCALGVSTKKLLGFIIHEKGIEIDLKCVEALRNVEAPTCMNDLHKFPGKVNFLKKIISNLVGKIDAFTSLL